MQSFLSHAPNKDASIWHQSLIGAVENISPNETAYFHRKAIIAQEYITSWKCDDEENRNIRWVKGLREIMILITTMVTYVNVYRFSYFKLFSILLKKQELEIQIALSHVFVNRLVSVLDSFLNSRLHYHIKQLLMLVNDYDNFLK